MEQPVIVKLSLSLSALNRLLGGDSELEVVLRHQVVAEFAKRHLKEVAETASYENACKQIMQAINEAAKEMFDVENMAAERMRLVVGNRLRSEITSLVRKQTQEAVDEALKGVIKYQSQYWAKEINAAVEKAVNAEIETQIKEGIQKRLTRAAQTGI